ncbi:hypothetical protein HYC85_029390 [Camellia sinensis]|uniref:CCHC-type domain-containing protein n=1 Tax=Camellia sinensis TaxID=4442 RepID=A0A7J7FY38_CAMSI|nr:hypothetical protein HYC85_029390 [Camellia sinensis]
MGRSITNSGDPTRFDLNIFGNSFVKIIILAKLELKIRQGNEKLNRKYSNWKAYFYWAVAHPIWDFIFSMLIEAATHVEAAVLAMGQNREEPIVENVGRIRKEAISVTPAVYRYSRPSKRWRRKYAQSQAKFFSSSGVLDSSVRRSREVQVVTCFKCGQLGHKSPACPQRKKAGLTVRPVVVPPESFSQLGFVPIECSVGKQLLGSPSAQTLNQSLFFYWAVAHPLWEHHFQVQVPMRKGDPDMHHPSSKEESRQSLACMPHPCMRVSDCHDSMLAMRLIAYSASLQECMYQRMSLGIRPAGVSSVLWVSGLRASVSISESVIYGGSSSTIASNPADTPQALWTRGRRLNRSEDLIDGQPVFHSLPPVVSRRQRKRSVSEQRSPEQWLPPSVDSRTEIPIVAIEIDLPAVQIDQNSMATPTGVDEMIRQMQETMRAIQQDTIS